MSSWQLGLDLVATFLLAAGLLFHYGNWYRHHVIVTLSVLVAWYFSFIIVFVLPIDISTTIYRQCLNSTDAILTTTTAATPPDVNSTFVAVTNGTSQGVGCLPPPSYVGAPVMSNLWRVVYWTSQCLTWLILPIMQSYTQAGEFHVKGKIRAALLDNAIYYGLYLFICAVLLVYLATKPGPDLNWQQLKAIASSASNSWGLFLLVFMLGYGLVSVPQSLWAASCKGHSLNNAYFKVAKLSQERNSAEESLDDVLESLQACTKKLTDSPSSPGHLLSLISTIEGEIPLEFRERMRRRRVVEADIPLVDEKTLVKLHRQVKKALQTFHRVERQWEDHIARTIYLEDVERSCKSGDRVFRHSFGGKSNPSGIASKLEWWWRCVCERWLLRLVSILALVMSLLVIWSEAVFFNKRPVLSVFAVFINLAKESYDYVTIELVATLTIAYMAACAFYTVFKIRVFNFYYLARGHQTDEYSLIFSGMLLCRLTPPLCLNVISVFQMDSHIVSYSEETSYTRVMGHMDVLSLISNGFNVYFPMGILIVALLTYFKVGLRVLTVIGFQQFLNPEDDITTELVSEGSQLTQREKRRRQRAYDSTSRVIPSSNASASSAARPHSVISERSSPGGSRLVGNPPTSSYYGTESSFLPGSFSQPPRDLFDDV